MIYVQGNVTTFVCKDQSFYAYFVAVQVIIFAVKGVIRKKRVDCSADIKYINLQNVKYINKV